MNKQFHEWLKQIVSGNQQYASMDGLIDRFENKGILTFESLYRYVFTKDDLNDIIGREFAKISYILWREIENQQKELMISSPTPNAAFSTPSINPMSQIQPATPMTNIVSNNEGKPSEGHVTNYIQ